MKESHEKEEHDNNFHHCEEAIHDVQHDKAINIGNEFFLNSSTNDTRCMQFQSGINHVSTQKDQPFKKYDEDHASLFDKINPKNTFEVTELYFNNTNPISSNSESKGVLHFHGNILGTSTFHCDFQQSSNVTPTLKFDVNHDRVRNKCK